MMNHLTFQGYEMESLLCEDTKRKGNDKMQGMAGMRRISEETTHKKKMGRRQMRKAGDGRDGSAVPNGLTESVVGGGASVHRAQCSPLIHLDRQTIPDKSSNKTVPTLL